MTVFVPKTAYKYPNNTLEIKAVGYKTKTVTMTREIRWACAILDAPLVLPLLFDIQSNNIWHSSPRKINYNLEKE